MTEVLEKSAPEYADFPTTFPLFQSITTIVIGVENFFLFVFPENRAHESVRTRPKHADALYLRMNNT